MDDNIGHPEKLIEEMLAHSLMMIKKFQENMENLLQKNVKWKINNKILHLFVIWINVDLSLTPISISEKSLLFSQYIDHNTSETAKFDICFVLFT